MASSKAYEQTIREFNITSRFRADLMTAINALLNVERTENRTRALSLVQDACLMLGHEMLALQSIAMKQAADGTPSDSKEGN